MTAQDFKDRSPEFMRKLERQLLRTVEIQTREIATAIEKGYGGTPGLNRGQETDRTASGNRFGLSPSEPGEPPKQVTGTLRAELDNDTQQSPTRIIGRIGYRTGSPALSYVLPLEYGTSVMASRPFLRPALDFHKRDFINRLGGIKNRIGG